jgi:hypothetical protein
VTRYLLLILFMTMLGGDALGLGFSIAPGFSAKNALLYVAAVLIACQAAVTRDRKPEMLSVITPFALLLFYAAFTWLVVVVVLDRPDYYLRPSFIRLKTKLADQLLMLLVFFYGVVSLKDALWLAKALVWVIIGGSLITVIDTFNIPDLGIITMREKDGRVEGIVGSAQEFGALMAFFLPAVVALWWTESGSRRWLALVGSGLTLIGVLMSASRGAVVGILGGSVMAAFHLRRWISALTILRVSTAAFVLGAIALIVLMATNFGDLVVNRMTHGIGTTDAHVLSSGRSTIWGKALREMMEFPSSFITGFGWEQYYQRPGHRLATHSVYIDRLYNLGLIGLALFIIPFLNAMAAARRALGVAPAAVAPYLIALHFALAAWIVAMAFSDIEGSATYVWAWTGVALRLAAASTERGLSTKPVTVMSDANVARSRPPVTTQSLRRVLHR